MRLLLQFGANATRLNNDGSHALEIARYTGVSVVCTVLLMDAANANQLKEQGVLQPALEKLLQRFELPSNVASHLRLQGIVTVHAMEPGRFKKHSYWLCLPDAPG